MTNYDAWKTESPEDERLRLSTPKRRRGRPAADDDSREADAYWERKLDEARER